MTHDSIGLGEDGPTHQPVEMLNSLRAMPNMVVIRPADGNETAGAYMSAMENKSAPTVIALSRQGLPNLSLSTAENVFQGAYVVRPASQGSQLRVILVSSGAEVSLCMQAAEVLDEAEVAHASKKARGHAQPLLGSQVQVVSMPSWELFDKQSVEYQQSIFPPGVPVLAVEAAVTTGWEKYSHAQFGMTSFGTSGPNGKVYEHFGFVKASVAKKAAKVVEHFGCESRPVSNLMDRVSF